MPPASRVHKLRTRFAVLASDPDDFGAR